MPIIEVTLAEGRTPAQLRELTDAVQRAGRYRTSSRLPTWHRCRVPRLRSTRTTPSGHAKATSCSGAFCATSTWAGVCWTRWARRVAGRFTAIRTQAPLWTIARISVVSGGALGFARPASAKCTFKKIDVPSDAEAHPRDADFAGCGATCKGSRFREPFGQG
jgi:hypothetical protein